MRRYSVAPGVRGCYTVTMRKHTENLDPVDQLAKVYGWGFMPDEEEAE